MKSKDKEFINSIKYSENKMAKKILRDARISKWIFYSMFLLETITYILIVINMENVNKAIFKENEKYSHYISYNFDIML